MSELNKSIRLDSATRRTWQTVYERNQCVDATQNWVSSLFGREWVFSFDDWRCVVLCRDFVDEASEVWGSRRLDGFTHAHGPTHLAANRASFGQGGWRINLWTAIRHKPKSAACPRMASSRFAEIGVRVRVSANRDWTPRIDLFSCNRQDKTRQRRYRAQDKASMPLKQT